MVKTEVSYLFVLRSAWDISWKDTVIIPQGTFVENVTYEAEAESYVFSIKDQPDVRYRCKHHWAFVVNTPENLQLLFAAEHLEQNNDRFDEIRKSIKTLENAEAS